MDSVITGNQCPYPLNFAASTLIPVLPPKIIGISSIVVAFFVLVVSYVRRQMPRKTLLALRRLLDDVDASVSLLADTRHALESRSGLKLLKNEASKCEESYLSLSSASWSSYPLSFLRLFRTIDTVKTETRHLLTSVKTQVEIERQAQYRAHSFLDVYIGTLAFGGTALLVSCIDCRLPHRTLPALQSLLNDVAHSVGLLADTDHGLKLRLAVQSLEDEISNCEIKYLRLSATPWSFYHRDFCDLVRSLRICTRESHALMITIKSHGHIESSGSRMTTKVSISYYPSHLGTGHITTLCGNSDHTKQ
ncbi:hypothetical protein C8J56DRAFT_1131082 [Mycena floridula]|nr:hypothetical protein C8J56DRAFT_1131082 [Mycena floridula]